MATANASTVVLFLLLLLPMATVDSVLQTDILDDIVPNSVWIVEPPYIAVAIRDRPYTLQCHSALPNVTYQWMYNNHILDLVNDSRRKILPNGSLFFNKVLYKKPGDAGSYRCLVQTTYGTIVSKTVTLQIAVFRDFDISPNNLTVSSEASRSVIRLTCHINSTPEATITWLKNDAVVSSSKKFITKVPGVLYIKNVDEKDSGNYRCMAKNYLLNKTRLSDVGHLNVENINAESSGSQSDIQPLAFISPTYLYPNVKYVTAGDNVTFECAASGVPSPCLNWSFTTSTGNKQNTKISDDEVFVNILSLTNVSSENSGVYTCLAVQPLKRWPDFAHTQTFRLEVMMPPIITTRPETQSMPLVKTIRYKCRADGNPYPNISWYHNGERLKSNGRVKIKEKQLLIVSNTVSKDSGIYQCFASNSYGTTWAGALFTISPSPFEPAPPTNISCRTLSLSQIQLSWQMSPKDVSNDPPILFRDDSIQLVPSHSGVSSASSSSSATVSTDKISRIIRIYTVHYMLTDGGDEVQNITEDHSIIIENLKPYQNYTFYVRVYNGKSGSDESEKVICRTQDKAPQRTLDLTIIPLSPISMSVEWPLIDVNLINGAVTQYQVMWKLLHRSSNYVQVLQENARQYTITGLKPGGQYEVKVLGIAQNGLPSIDFRWNLVDLPPIDPSLPKPILTFTVDQTIKLFWSVKHVKFDYYQLMYRVTGQTNQSEMLSFTFSPDKNHHIINYTSDLEVFEVLLNCVSNNRQGESVFRTIAIVLDILSPPSQIEAVATSFHTLNLSWVPPDSVDLSSLLFIITYDSVSNSSQNSTTIFTDLGVTSLEISGLKPYSLYEIKISTHDKNNRKSKFSQKIQIRTLQGVPGIVEQIEWHWINNYTVRITWAEPINSNGVIMGYYVLYTSELHVPPTSWQQLNVSQHKHSLDLSGLSYNTQYFFMVRAATDAGFGPQSGIFSIIPLTPLNNSPVNSKYPDDSPALYMKDEQLLGIVIGCVIGVCCILICATSIVLKRQCVKAERIQDLQHNSLNSDMAYCAQNLRPFTVDNVQHEESVPLNDIHYIARHMDGKSRYSNNMSGMALLPLLDQSNVRNNDSTNIHIIENPQCTVDVDGYDVDSLLSESAEGGAGTEESGCSDQLAKNQKCGDLSVIDDGFHEHVELNKMLVG